MKVCTVCGSPVRPKNTTGLCFTHKWEPYKRRNRQMAAAYKAGEAIDSIATRHGLQRETIRLVLREQGCLITPSEPPAPRRYSLQSVIQHTSVVFGCTVDEIKSASRYRHMVRPRQCIILIARRFCRHLSYSQIGRALNRDHSTIITQYETGRLLLGTDAGFRGNVIEVAGMLLTMAKPKPAPAVIAPQPAPEPEDYELDDVDALSRAVARHYAQEMAA